MTGLLTRLNQAPAAASACVNAVFRSPELGTGHCVPLINIAGTPGILFEANCVV